jgi:tetratricopeptide (TPR) repeat protein
MLTPRTDRIADAVRLLAAGVAVATDPTLRSALKSAPWAYDALKRIAAAPPSSVGRLAETLAGAARATFAATRDLPPDADELYVQMVEIGMVGAPEIVAAGMDAGAVAEAMLGKLTDPEHRSGPMVALFRALTVPVLERLLADKAFAADLTPAFMRGVLGGIADVSAKLDDIAGQSRDTLEALALRFGEPEPERLAFADLKGFLIEKAKDYRRLLAQVRQIEDREGRIGNLKAAAEAAIEDLRLDEAKTLIRDAIAMQRAERTLPALREDAALVETEAGIALLENDADEAFRLLSGCADSFEPFDPDEAGGRRNGYAERLHDHGLRYGGDGLVYAERLSERILDDVPETSAPLLWAETKNNIGVIRVERATLIGGVVGIGLLRSAVLAFRDALDHFEKMGDRRHWADVQNNLGNALTVLGDWEGGAAGVMRLQEAAEAFDSASQAIEDSIKWASIQKNLGNVLMSWALEAKGAPRWICWSARLVLTATP